MSLILDKMIGYEVGREQDAHKFLTSIRQSIDTSCSNSDQLEPMANLFGIYIERTIILNCENCGNCKTSQHKERLQV